ncbi:MAG: HlyD family efflux transporter periplasmic adaptor subunit [Planctomycetota bacterium]|nr:HlyD family efflux transporter periplasmic adaptor subunit [Planctomycetota bacterium]
MKTELPSNKLAHTTEERSTDPSTKTFDVPRRMIRLRPTKLLGDRFPAMHLVRSSWFARFIARVTCLLLVGLGLAAIFLPWQQTSRCEGEVVARLPQLRRQVVSSSVKGVVSWMKEDLREGSLVTEEEIIMELDAISKDQLLQTRQQEKSLLEKLEFAKYILDNTQDQVITEKANLQRSIEAYEADVKASYAKWQQAVADVQGQERVYDQAKKDLTVAEKLKGEFIPIIEYERAVNRKGSEEQRLRKTHEAEDEAFQEKVSKEQTLESKKKEVETKIIELGTKVAKSQSDIATITKDLQDVLAKLGELDRLKIKSPSKGRIQAILSQVATNNVKEGDKLFEVIPDTSDLAVELNVRGLDLPLIHVGDEVRLQFDGWPAIQFVGWPSVAIGTFGGKVIAVNPSDDSKGNFKIIVGPDLDDPKQVKWPDSRYLRQGVKARGWVILSTVPLGFEIWRQLNGFPPTIDKSMPSEEKAKDPKMPKFK